MAWGRRFSNVSSGLISLAYSRALASAPIGKAEGDKDRQEDAGQVDEIRQGRPGGALRPAIGELRQDVERFVEKDRARHGAVLIPCRARDQPFANMRACGAHDLILLGPQGPWRALPSKPPGILVGQMNRGPAE